MKKFKYIIAIVVALGLIAFVLTRNKAKNEAETAIVNEKNAAVAVRIDTIRTEDISASFIANGNFEAFQALSLGAESAGRVMSVYADEGTRVSIGQVLAVIKGDKLSVDLQSAQAAYQTALTDKNRYENAYKTGGVTSQQLDQAKLALANAKARLDQAKINFGDATIRATINGVVNKRYIEPGSVVASGTPLFDLVNVSKLKLRTSVSEGLIASIKNGDAVKIKASVFPDKEFKGKVTFIAPVADASLNFPVEVEVENPDSELRAGMYGTAHFSGGKQQKVLIAPRNGFVGSVNSNQVFVVDGSKVKLTKVVSGRIFGEKVEILSGLKQGDKIVISGQINLTDGTEIAPIK